MIPTEAEIPEAFYSMYVYIQKSVQCRYTGKIALLLDTRFDRLPVVFSVITDRLHLLVS